MTVMANVNALAKQVGFLLLFTFAVGACPLAVSGLSCIHTMSIVRRGPLGDLCGDTDKKEPHMGNKENLGLKIRVNCGLPNN